MTRRQWGLIAALVLAVAIGRPIQAAGKLFPGQELIYSGTLEWKQSGTDVPAIVYRAPLKLWALVTGADPAQGYMVIVMRDIRPEKRQGQENLVPFAEVFTERYRANLTRGDSPPRPSRSVFGAPLIPLIWNRPIPFGFSNPLGSLADLQVGRSWWTDEPISLPGVRGPSVVYTVSGENMVDGRSCVKIERTAKELPVKNEMEGSSVDLVSFAGALCVDRVTGLVVSDQWRATVRYTSGEQQALIDVKAVQALKEMRQLSAGELASRIKQAEAVYRVERMAFPEETNADRKKVVGETRQAIAGFRQAYPGSPYAGALVPIETYLEPEARLLALQGKAAPEFKLPTVDGAEQTLGAYHGKLILLNFFASW
jgi:hypothetical protein